MKTTGRRAWRKWCKRARLRMNSHHKALYRAAIMRKKQPERTPLPPKQFTVRSLVGMSQSSRKRRRWEWVQAAGQYDAPGAAKAIGVKLRIGERLRPCPGCCACRGCEQDLTRVNPVSGNTLHWAGPVRKHTFQCPMGPPLAEKNSKQIASMLKWQEALPDDCDGSGVMPARKQR